MFPPRKEILGTLIQDRLTQASISIIIPENKHDCTSQEALMVKSPPAKAGDIRDLGLIPGSVRCPGGGNGNPFQCSCLEIPWTEKPGELQGQ